MMADAVLDAAGKNVTISESEVNIGRMATLDAEQIPGGNDIVGDVTHEGVRTITCTGRIASTDVDKIDDLVQNGASVTFTSDLQALFTTNTITNVFVASHNFGYRHGNLYVTLQLVEDTST